MGNYLQDMPVQTSDATITVFVRDVRIQLIALPPPPSANTQYDVAPGYVGGPGRPWGAPDFAWPESNRALAQYARVLCIEMTNSSAVVQESQRYYDQSAFGFLSTTALTCPPKFDTCRPGIDASEWSCSKEVPNAVVPCPGGMSNAAFCDSGETCAYGPESVGLDSASAASAMCECTSAGQVPTWDARVYRSDGTYGDDFCSDEGTWQLIPSAQWAYDADADDAYDDASGTGCALKASWTSASTMYAWLYPDACCGATDTTWSNMQVAARVKATSQPNAQLGQVRVVVRDPAGNPQQDNDARYGHCGVAGPFVGYEFVLDYAGQQATVVRKQGCDVATTLSSTSLSLALDTWYQIVGIADGTQLSFYVDGALELTVSDSIYSSGSAGVEVDNLDATVADVVVSDLDLLGTCV